MLGALSSDTADAPARMAKVNWTVFMVLKGVVEGMAPLFCLIGVV